jgi:hypothetical protein
MDRFPVRRSTSLLAIVFLLCCLAVHFISENLTTPDPINVIEQTGNGVQIQEAQDGCEDDFALALLNSLPIQSSLSLQVEPALTRFLSILILPLLPPPNLEIY